MAIISGYTSLGTAVTDYLARSDLSSFVPNFIQNFEERFYRHPENWAPWMEDTLNVTITSSVAAVPSDYLGLKTAYISGDVSQPLKRISLDQLYLRYPRGGDYGLPYYIARNGTNFEFGPIPSSGVLVGTYYARQTLLRIYAADAAAHPLITGAPDLLLYGALLEAHPFLVDDARVPLWKAFYDEALAAYRAGTVEEAYDSPQIVVA